MDRMLNIGYGIEVIEGRLNGSAEEVENNRTNFKNTTFTKKIGGRGMVSAVCQKKNVKNFMSTVFNYEQNLKTKDGKQIKLVPNPMKYAADDIFGFMMASKVELTEDEYNALEDNQKELYKKNKKSYIANITKKRVSRLQMSSLVNVSNRKIQMDFHTCGSTTDSLPYKLEVYSGVMAGIANLNLSKVGKYHISNDATEYRDYSVEEAESLNVKSLDKEERLNRIESVLRGIEYISIKGNQTNHLTDTKPKFVILCDYSWGNNAFQGLMNENGINIDMLKESLEQNKEYRLSNTYIGINQFFDETYNNIKIELEEKLKDYNFIEISDVHTAFNNYINYMKETLED